MRGFVESVRSFQIRGWAIDTANPQRRPAVIATLDELVIASGTADLYRGDLIPEGDGSGRHGFILNLNEALTAEAGERLVVSSLDDDGEGIGLRRLQAALDSFRPAEATATSVAANSALSRRIVPGPFADLSQHPVFILGAARSGTSAIGQAIAQNTRYAGDEEGHLFGVILPLLDTVADFYRLRGEEWGIGRVTAIARVPQVFFEAGIKRLLAEAARALYPDGHWIDKTPRQDMIEAAGLFLEIWPNARFIFAKRRGIENITSRLRKFPTITFAEHCSDWAGAMEAWLRVRPRLAGRFIEIDQIDLARSPAAEAERLAKFLALDAAEAGRLAVALEYDLPERTATNISEPTSIQESGWSAEQIECFTRLCGPMMIAFDYSYDAGYYQAF